MMKDKEKMCKHHNKPARNLPSFPQNQKVYVQGHPQCNQWTPATVTKLKRWSHLNRDRTVLKLLMLCVELKEWFVNNNEHEII